MADPAPALKVRTITRRARPPPGRVTSCADLPERTAPAPEPPVSATIPDWSRETVGPLAWEPSRRLLRAIRMYQRHRAARDPVGVAQRMYAVAEHRFWSAITGADIPVSSTIAGGLLLPHPNGVVIHPDAPVGPNCLIMQQVTTGYGPRPGLPVIGGHVDVGAGAKILGGVRVGDHAKIGANAVVIDDVPEGATAVGVPARSRASAPRPRPRP